MGSYSIDRITVSDLRYPLPSGAGSDAVHTEPEYCLAVTQLFRSAESYAEPDSHSRLEKEIVWFAKLSRYWRDRCEAGRSMS